MKICDIFSSHVLLIKYGYSLERVPTIYISEQTGGNIVYLSKLRKSSMLLYKSGVCAQGVRKPKIHKRVSRLLVSTRRS